MNGETLRYTHYLLDFFKLNSSDTHTDSVAAFFFRQRPLSHEFPRRPWNIPLFQSSAMKKHRINILAPFSKMAAKAGGGSSKLLSAA